MSDLFANAGIGGSGSPRLAVHLAAAIGGFHTGDGIVVDGAYSIF